MSNPLIAQPKETSAVAGVPLLEDATGLKDAIESKNWAAVAIGAVGTALDVLTAVMDPFGAIFAAGVGWLMEHVGPLKEALNALTGNADEIAAQAETWTNVAKELESVSGELTELVKKDLQSWTGEAADTYRAQTADTSKLIASAQKGSEGAASGVKTAGEIVAAVRSLVRDTIADLVGHLISWALQVVFTLGIGMTWVVPQVVAAVAKTASKISQVTTKLVKAIKALIPLLKKAGTLFEDAGKALKGLKGGKPKPAAKPKDIEIPKGSPAKDKDGGSTSPAGDHSSSGDSVKPAGDHSGNPDGPGKDTKTNPSGDPGKSDTGGNGSPGGHDEPGPNNPPGTKDPSGDRGNDRDIAVGKNECTVEGEPVDVARGALLVDDIDLVLPSPLVLERLHLSSYRSGRWFGPTWVSTVDQRLEAGREEIRYFAPDGAILVYPRSGAGGPVLPVEGNQRPLTATGDGGYRLTDPLSGTELVFGPGRGGTHLLRTVTDAAGAAMKVEYDELGAPRLIRHSAGYRVGLDTEGGRITAIWVLGEGTGRVLVRRFGYDDLGRLTRVINSSGLPTQYDYDAEGRLTGWQDRNGIWFRYLYDGEGRCVRTVGDQGFYDGEFAYDTVNRITRYTDSLGRTKEFHFNEAAQPVREVSPLGAVTMSGWDRYDRLVSRTDPLGRTTGFEYTAEGLLTAVVRPDGSRAGVRTAADGTLTVSVRAGGRTWRRVYPPGTAPDLFSGQAGTATEFAQDGQLSGAIPAAASPDPVERDQFGRPRVVSDVLGGRTRLAWTVDGRRAARTGPGGEHEEWRYDAEGNLVQRRDARFEYGPFDLPVAKIDATGARTRYEYDTELQLVRVTNPSGLSWDYRYDGDGRLVSESDFDDRERHFGYDAVGRLVRSSDGLGAITEYAYDALGNVTERRTGTATVRYEYDPVGFLIRATEDSCVLEIERDETGRVVRESVDGRAVTYAHDPSVVRRTTPSGAPSAWTLDDAGNAVTLSVAGHDVTFRHDEAGREVERVLSGTTVLAQAFDPEHRLLAQTVTTGGRVVQERGYHYRADGHLIGVDDALSGPTRYQLDATGRVTAVTRTDGDESYRYDSSGNILHARVPSTPPDAGPRGYTGNRLSAAGATRYLHDRQGRLVARHETTHDGVRTWTYRWDAQDRLLAVDTPDGVQWCYRYDPLGRRVAKQRWLPGAASPAEEIVFTWSGQLLVEQEHRRDGAATLTLTWDHLPGTVRPVTQTEHLGAAVRFFSFVTDPIGTPVDLVDAEGAIAWHGTPSLWGRTRAGGTPLRFPGQYADDETGLHYNVFRYYDPGTGRYLSQDPLGLAPAPNPAAYVPNPLADADPLGLGGCMSKNDPDPDSDVGAPATPHGGDNAGHVQGSNPPPPREPTPPPSNEPPPPDIPSGQWPTSTVPGGTKVYHSTDPSNLESLLGDGIRPAGNPTHPAPTGVGANQWGGGELGQGFYTHKNSESAQNYTLHLDNPAVLEFEVKNDLNGKQSPGGWIGNMKNDDYRQDAAFITSHNDPDEIKFHNGQQDLKLTKIHAYGMEFSSYDEFKDAFGL